jgi:hypothetical protein
MATPLKETPPDISGQAKSESDFSADLDVARRSYGSVPHSKARAGYIGVKRGRRSISAKAVPIPNVEELGSDFECHALRDARLLGQAEVVVVKPKPSDV